MSILLDEDFWKIVFFACGVFVLAYVVYDIVLKRRD